MISARDVATECRPRTSGTCSGALRCWRVVLCIHVPAIHSRLAGHASELVPLPSSIRPFLEDQGRSNRWTV